MGGCLRGLYRKKRAAAEADPNDEELTWLWVQAIDRLLMAGPVPDLNALLLKLEWAREKETKNMPDALSPLIWNALVADVRKLTRT